MSHAPPDTSPAIGTVGAVLFDFDGTLAELTIDFGEMRRRVYELLEEAGYEVEDDLQYITTFYPSPGGTSERAHLFLGEVDHDQRIGKGGGVVAEGEDTQVVVLPFREAMDMIERGEICDAKTIIALQHLALLKVEVANQVTTFAT